MEEKTTSGANDVWTIGYTDENVFFTPLQKITGNRSCI